MKRFLFIANGFDLAHRRPTKYTDFLYACCKMTGIELKKADDILKEYANNFISDYGDYKEKIEKNFWVNHVINCISSIPDKWIDFEKEIKEVCEETIEEGYYETNELVGNGRKRKMIPLDTLKKDLDELIEILNAYLVSVDNYMFPINCYYQEIVDFVPTDVISFNYTSTYRKIYYHGCDVDDVHGEINEDKIDKSSIVLGFNSMNNKNKNVEYGEFLKTYQMVNKDVDYHILQKYDTGNVDIHGNEKDVYSMFFGHSLDKTDEDMIKIAFSISKKIYLVYYNDEHKASMIKNIIDIYGDVGFRNLCIASNRKVIFVRQSSTLPLTSNIPIQNFFEFVDDDNMMSSFDFKCMNIRLSSFSCIVLAKKIKETFVDDNDKTNNLLRKLYGISINNIKEINCGYDREEVIDKTFKNLLQSN